MLVECLADGGARYHIRIGRCRITVGFASGEERTHTFLMFGAQQISFRPTGHSSTKTQLMKTAESVVFTLVEGCGAFTQKEMARFVEMSIKSTKELEYQLFLARDYGVLPRKDWKSLTVETIEIRRMLCGLRRRILGDDDQGEADASSRRGYSKRRTEKLKSPDAQTER